MSSTRIGRWIREDGLVLSLPEAELLEQIRQTNASSYEMWREPDGMLGVQVTEDGMTLTGFFRDGELSGDWM